MPALWSSAAVGAASPAPAGAVRAPSPLQSAISTASDSWVTLPMGNLSDPSNTFWELFHSFAGSSHWSLVTPPGVADNGGLVAGASTGAALVGVLPSQLLHFSPLAQSSDGGASWAPGFLPTGLAPLPDALAYQAAAPGGAIALVERRRERWWRRSNLSSWFPLVSATNLRRVSPAAVSRRSTGGDPAQRRALVATGCRERPGRASSRSPRARGGRVGSHSGAHSADPRPPYSACRSPARPSRRWWRPAWAGAGVGRAVALGQLAVEGICSARAEAGGVGPGQSPPRARGRCFRLLGGAGTPVAFEVASGGPWSDYPRLPARTTGLAAPAGRLDDGAH